MNIFKILYCRAFQQALHLAIPFLPYRKPVLLENEMDGIRALEKNHIQRVMLVTDQGVRRLGLTESLEQCLKENGIDLVVYDKTVANPTIRQVEEARALYLSTGCQGLIGFGGGSSMDCAKAVGARIARPGKPLKKMKGILKVRKKLPVLIAVPTTAGTGSETTLAAVITDDETRLKYPINDFPLIPRYALLDPKVTRSLPPFLTATTGMDALTHAVEAYIGKSTTRETRRDSIEAVRLILKNIRRVWEDGEDLAARKEMLYGAYLAGCSFTKSYVGYVHAVAHSLGGKYNTPHGLANAVLLPYVLRAYGSCIHKKLRDLAAGAGLCSPQTDPQTGSRRFIQEIEDLQKELGIGNKLSGIRREDIPYLAEIAEKEANPLYPVPRLMDKKELEGFYEMVMKQDDRSLGKGGSPA